MISPRAFELIIKHFNEIDISVAKRTMRKRPWSEISLTSVLCDLMDEETQNDDNLNYLISDLKNDLELEDGLYGIDLAIDTIAFPVRYERYVSQSDIGIKFILENKLEPRFSWEKSYFLQAKRLIPNEEYPKLYNESAKFSSVDKGQQKRIEVINRVLGCNFVKYLMYCPRPDHLEKSVALKLAYLRNKHLVKDIFDFTSGLKLHKELLNNENSIKAGLLITNSENSVLNFGKLHSEIMNSVMPFSWFIADNFFSPHFIDKISPRDRIKPVNKEVNDNILLINGILSGDSESIDTFIDMIQGELEDDYPESFPVLPKYSINLKLIIGPHIQENELLKFE